MDKHTTGEGEKQVGKLARLRRRLAEAGWRATVGRAVRWLYWNGHVYHLRLHLLHSRFPRDPWWHLRQYLLQRVRPICDSVRAWSEAHPEADCQVVLAGQTISRRLPQTIEPEVHELFTRAQRKEVPEKYLARIPAAKLVGRNGLLVLLDGRCAPGWAFDPSVLLGDPD